ncbi:hypothetical protein FXF61_00640 [Pseudomonas sp. C27(2019)]|uniref:hypothetical protein n=1 Tax=Pseudomonas sp. C27(2019) TaxID=2604941 RepID=UPI001243DC6A|nr:hypothetical protein [Pseudomonas sp. C27(2019)]QEY57778.1 hypothetical protein FXF61_00640 [Pseudomonas sp. C27(2019)]
MITTVREFQDAVAFETYVLDKMLPVISGCENDSIDLRGSATAATVQITLTDNLSASAVESIKSDLAPLLFGSAWKVLDLAVELILNVGALTADRRSGYEWSISAKQIHAAQGAGGFHVLTSDRQVWVAIGAVYANTVEHRHCLVHRTAVIDSNTGALGGSDRSGNTLTSLSLDQLNAIARIASLVAEGIVDGGIAPRNRDHLCYFLDQVAPHTNQTPFGIRGQGAPVVIHTDLKNNGESLVVDVQVAAERAARVFQDVLHFNVVFDIPDGSGRKLKANLEEIPSGQILVDLDALPDWLSFI